MKVTRFSSYQGRLSFEKDGSNRQEYLDSFLGSELGLIYQAIPWDALVHSLQLRDHSKGPRSIFSPRGKLGLMFLKHYAGVSDKRLIEQLNSNIDYQIFCDVVIRPSDRLRNYKIVSEIRCEIAKKLTIAGLQKVLSDSWRCWIEHKDSITCDATCYESYLRYPTDVKLLYEAVSWNYQYLQSITRQRSTRMIRTKYRKWMKRYKSYCKNRRPSKKLTRSTMRGFLRLLDKINKTLEAVEREQIYDLPNSYWSRRIATQQLLKQQSDKFYKGIKPTNRIVSLDKPYIRPIVRGKEIKKVEFGAKVHKLQIDGISFIEHLSFDAFNEATRLENTVYTAQQLMQTKVKVLGADAIYATNKNRNYVSKHKISTDFKRKGRRSVHHDHYQILIHAITKERATRLEGSFGTDKEHFLLNRIKARTEQTERLWIFFGIHTSNALKIGRRIAHQQTKAA